MSKVKTVPIPPPQTSMIISAGTVASGQPVYPIDRIKLFSASDWEQFIQEWVDSLRSNYISVEKCAGAGDMGRDIVAICADQPNAWDNYQCKHYKTSLQPSHIWVELGKLIYYTRRGDFTYPRRYYFVAPLGAGTTLSNLFRNPERLRANFFDSWDKHCRNGITSTATIELDEELKSYIETLDFSIFEAVPPLRIIEEHANTRWHVTRFGGGLPQRPPVEAPPEQPTETEANYVRALLDAYGDYLKRYLRTIDDLLTEKDLNDHFGDSRLEFYSAESLRMFSRDTLPQGEFEKLQDELHGGIKDEIRYDFENGYLRVLAVVKTARSLQLSSHALISQVTVRDRGGICHQLANDKKVKWVK